MQTRSKALLLTLCTALLVVASVLGTMAYLTSQDKVTNTFTVGSVALTLDEAKVTDMGVVDTGASGRVKANAYHLLPGHTYTKDPIVHVAAASENCYVFVKVENGIAAFEAATVEGGYQRIAAQITANGWTALTGVANVYYKEYTKGQADKDLEVFQQFKIADNADTITGWTGINPTTTKVEVTAYAVQKDGFATASAAWTATFGAP